MVMRWAKVPTFSKLFCILFFLSLFGRTLFWRVVLLFSVEAPNVLAAHTENGESLSKMVTLLQNEILIYADTL